MILKASPVLTGDWPMEGSPEHMGAKKALRRYWADYGFQVAAEDYLVADSLGGDFGA